MMTLTDLITAEIAAAIFAAIIAIGGCFWRVTNRLTALEEWRSIHQTTANDNKRLLQSLTRDVNKILGFMEATNGVKRQEE